MKNKQLKKDLKIMHDYLNFAYFGGVLPRPRFIVRKNIKLKKVGQVFGFYEHCKEHPSKSIIAIVNCEDWLETLIHEMIHQFQYIHNCKDKEHGKTFKIWRDIFCAEFNLNKKRF